MELKHEGKRGGSTSNDHEQARSGNRDTDPKRTSDTYEESYE